MGQRSSLVIEQLLQPSDTDGTGNIYWHQWGHFVFEHVTSCFIAGLVSITTPELATQTARQKIKKSFDNWCLDFHDIGWGRIKWPHHHQLQQPPALFPTPSESDTRSDITRIIKEHLKYMRKKWQQWCSGRILSQHGKIPLLPFLVPKSK